MSDFASTRGLLPSNGTTTPLGAAATFTGIWADVAWAPSIVAACKSDVAGTLYLEFDDSVTAVTAQSSLSYTLVAGINKVHKLTVTRRYFRVRFVNGATEQTTFALSSMAGSFSSLTAPSDLSLGIDADAIATRAITEETDIARGKRSGFSIVNKFGRNQDIDTAAGEDVWEGGGFYTGFPVGDDELVTVVSSSANDTSAGSGARTVMIYGLDTDGNAQSEIVILNGATLVDSVNTYTRLNRIVVLTSGSSNSAFNAGVISVAHKTTTANIFGAVPVGANQSQIACYTIPAGKTGYLKKLSVEMKRSNSASADGALWVRPTGGSPKLQRIFSIAQTSPFVDEIYGGLVYPALTDIAVRITAVSTNNTGVTANFDLLLVDD